MENNIGSLSIEDKLEEESLSKNALKKRQAAEAKELKKKEMEAKLAAEKLSREQSDFAKQNYGKLPLNQSSCHIDKKRISVANINESIENQKICVIARVHNSRGTGKQVFLVLRDRINTIQAIAAADEKNVSKQMVKFATSIPKETIVEVEGMLVKVQDKIDSCTHHWHEIHIQKIFIISEASLRLPFSIIDASRPEEQLSMEGESDKSYVRVNLDTRLNHRVIDLRTPTNQAIFKIKSGIKGLFVEYFCKHDFVSIETPKLVSSGSEGGANVFELPYFGRKAFLAQSPQLFKQMTVCGDFDRVFEIGPVFRAENSFTHRHMTEFTGIDLEMKFNDHYHEVLDFIAEMFIFVFDEIKIRYAKELEIVKKQYPFEDLKYPRKSLVLKFPEAIHLLREAGETIGDFEDFNTTQEKLLGRIIKAKYDTDFYVLDKFPLSVRPFYTMPDPSDNNYSNSYDFFIRGEEILSGAQRVHDYELLLHRIKEQGINSTNLQFYLDSFIHGAPPHAGGGIGLERVVMFYLGLPNIKMASLFPRDPNRLTP